MKKYSIVLTAALVLVAIWSICFAKGEEPAVKVIGGNEVISIANSNTNNNGNNNSQYSQEEQAVYDMYRKFYDYKIAQNIEGLNEILDPNFQLVHMTGYSQPKAEWLSQVADGQMRYFGDQEERVIIHVNGEKATLQSRNKVDARIYGTRHVWNLELNFDMEKRDGQWIIMNAVAHSY